MTASSLEVCMRLSRSVVVRLCAMAGLFAGAAMVSYDGLSARVPAEQIFFSQFNPTLINGLHFDGTALVADDLDPRSDASQLHASLDTNRSLAVTERYYLTANSFQSLTLAVVDRQTGVELPRPRTSQISAVAVAASADGHLAYVLGTAVSGGSAQLAVIDLDPQSATFLTQLSALSMGASTTAVGMAAEPNGTRVFVQTTEANGVHVKTIDVSTPAAPVLAIDTLATNPTSVTPVFEQPGTGYLRVFTSAGSDYLIVPRRTAQIYRIEANGALTFVQSLMPTAAATASFARDVVVVSTPGGERAYVARIDFTATNVLSVQAFDMTPSGGGFTATPLASAVLANPTPNTEGNDRIAVSLDGQRLYVLRANVNGTQAGQILAVDRAAVESAPASAVQSVWAVAPAGNSSAQGLAVAPEVAPSPLSISGVAIDGVPNAVLINDQPRTLTISGTGLGDVTQASVGLTRAVVTAASAGTVTVQVPALVPAAAATLLLTATDGSVAANLTIANAPAVFPPYTVFASSSAANDVWVLNAATGSSVARRFTAGPGSADATPSADGRVLVTQSFRGSTATLHSLVNDAALGLAVDQPLAAIEVGPSPLRSAINPVRPRAYVATVNSGAIAVLDTDVHSATFGTALSTFSVLNGATSVGLRSLTMSPDGRYLYVGRSIAPHLLVVDVASDVTAPADFHYNAIPAAPAGTPRVDGLAISPDGTTLYLATSGETSMRIFDLATPTAPVQTAAVALPGAVPGDVHRIQVLPNNRFVYVTSRTTGMVDVFDTGLSAFVAQIPTGAFTNDPAVSPDSSFVFVGVGEIDAVLTVDARETVNGLPNANLHQVVATTGGGVGLVSVSVSSGLATDAGPNIVVSPAPGVTVTFTNVTDSGVTTASSSNAGTPGLPPDYVFPGVPVYHSIETTAEYSGPVTVCLAYSDATLTPVQEAAMSLLHAENGALVDGTTSVDTATNQVCGSVTSLGTFTVAMHDPDGPVLAGIPASVTAEATSAAGASVTFGPVTASDPLSGVDSVSCDFASGDTFPLGATTVTCSARDVLGHLSQQSFVIAVVDTTAPVVDAVAGVTTAATSPAGALVSYASPTATDIVDGAIAVTCLPASGSTFPVGVTVVTCRATDARGNEGHSLFSVTVTPPPPPVAAAADAHSGQWNTLLTVAAPGVLGNDTGTGLTAQLVSGPTHGVVTLAASGAFTYMPAADFAGVDRFTYRATDGVNSSTAVVKLTITSPCRVERSRHGRGHDHRDHDGDDDFDDRDCARGTPVAKKDTFETRKGRVLSVGAPGVLRNDRHAASVSLIAGPAHGTLALAANGAFVYAPATGVAGKVTFTYVARSRTGVASATATVTIIVRGHWDGDDCDHDRKRRGHAKHDNCEHDRDERDGRDRDR